MPPKQTVVLGWTGRGRLADLRSSLEFVLAENGVRAKVTEAGASVVVVGPEPLGVAALLGWMPGVSWIAAGMTGSSLKELGDSASILSKRYLRRGDRFSVEAEGTGDVISSDLGGNITSVILETVKGSRVSVDSPKVRFRTAYDGRSGVVGAEVRAGVGGVPTGRESVVCLVSGGMHSAVLAWMAMLQGFRVLLIHAKTGEESLRAVARLYSELSHRGDPRGLGLKVLEGDSISAALGAYATRSKEPVFGGFHSQGSRSQSRIPRVLAPLYLMSDELFQSVFDELGVRCDDALANWEKKGSGITTTKSFGGRVADASDVLDGLR